VLETQPSPPCEEKKIEKDKIKIKIKIFTLKLKLGLVKKMLIGRLELEKKFLSLN
jgi:hypothetical protein